MNNFVKFKLELQKHFDEMQKEVTHLFEVNVDKDELWNISEMGNIHTIVKEDPDTGVQYIIIMDSYKNSIAITRRDNADGTPYISKSSNP